MQSVQLGTVIHATLRPEDLIPAFVEKLKELGDNSSFVAGVTMPDSPEWDEEDAQWELEELFDRLDDYAPPFCRFGAHEGDGSDFGFWVCEDSIRDAEADGELIRLPAGDDVPQDTEAEYILYVSDHGNLSLHSIIKSAGPDLWA